MTLRETMSDWCDWDEAAQAYGQALGVFDGASRRQVSQIVLSNNALGDGMHAGMMALVEAGVVERREEPDEQFRWIFGSLGDILGPTGPMQTSSEVPDLGAMRGSSPGATGANGGAGARRRWWQRR